MNTYLNLTAYGQRQIKDRKEAGSTRYYVISLPWSRRHVPSTLLKPTLNDFIHFKTSNEYLKKCNGIIWIWMLYNWVMVSASDISWLLLKPK